MKFGDYYPEQIPQCPPSPNSSTQTVNQRERIQQMNDDFGNESLLVNMDHLVNEPELVEPEIINDQVIENVPDVAAVPVDEDAPEIPAVPVIENAPEEANQNLANANDVTVHQEPENMVQNAPEQATNGVRPRTVLGGQTIFEAILEISQINAVSDGLTWYKFTAPEAIKLRGGNQAEFLVGYTDVDVPLCRYQDKLLTRNVAIQVRPKNENIDTQTSPPPSPPASINTAPASVDTPPPSLEGSNVDEAVNEVQDNIFTHDPLAYPPAPTTTMEQDRSRANFNLKK